MPNNCSLLEDCIVLLEEVVFFSSSLSVLVFTPSTVTADISSFDLDLGFLLKRLKNCSCRCLFGLFMILNYALTVKNMIKIFLNFFPKYATNVYQCLEKKNHLTTVLTNCKMKIWQSSSPSYDSQVLRRKIVSNTEVILS